MTFTPPITLPRLNQTGANEWSDVQANCEALKVAVEELGEDIKAFTGFKWYTPKAIATEESRENTEFGFLATEDKIENVVVPTNGLMEITFVALVKSSDAGAGAVGLFIDSNALKTSEEGIEADVKKSTTGTGFVRIRTGTQGTAPGLLNTKQTSIITTGGALTGIQVGELAAGTYTVGAKYRASSGSVTAKERKLYVAVRGK